MNALVLENPRAGRAAQGSLARAVERLVAHGWSVATRCPGSVEELAAIGAHPPAVDAILVAGGDGTLSAFVQSYPADGPLVGLLPVGTANVVARDLGLPLDPVAAADALASHRAVIADVGVLERPGRPARRFVLSAGAGDVGAAVLRVSLPLKRIVGGAAYGFSFAGSLLRRSTLIARVDGARILAGSVIVTATRHYAGGFVPDAASQPGDGRLDLHVLPPGLAAAAAFAWRASQGMARAVRAAEVAIESEAAVECDGDAAGLAPCVIRPGHPIRMIAPGLS